MFLTRRQVALVLYVAWHILLLVLLMCAGLTTVRMMKGGSPITPPKEKK